MLFYLLLNVQCSYSWSMLNQIFTSHIEKMECDILQSTAMKYECRHHWLSLDAVNREFGFEVPVSNQSFARIQHKTGTNNHQIVLLNIGMSILFISQCFAFVLIEKSSDVLLPEICKNRMIHSGYIFHCSMN